MAMNLVRTGSAALVGAASGIGESQAPLVISSTQNVSWGLIAEVAAVGIGAILQFASPFTAPNMADGLVDGGIALLAARGTAEVMKQTAPAPYAVSSAVASRAVPSASPAMARPQIGGAGRVPKVSLT